MWRDYSSDFKQETKDKKKVFNVSDFRVPLWYIYLADTYGHAFWNDIFKYYLILLSEMVLHIFTDFTVYFFSSH